jgi:hypothetical protein
MKSIRLFHFFETKYEHIIREIEKSNRKNILQQSVTVFSGIGRYAILSFDAEVDGILSKAGCHELSRENTMLNAIVQEPDVFQFCYGNKELLSRFN